MYIRNLTVPQAVKEIIISNEFYLKAIKSGIANYTALANKIHEDVEILTRTRVNIGTIVVAVKRFADIINELDEDHNSEFNRMKNTGLDSFSDERDKNVNFVSPPSDTRMTLTGSIIDINLNNHRFLKNIYDMMEEFAQETFFEYNLIHTAEKIRIFTEDIYESRKIISILTEKYNGKITQGLSKITITLLDENIVRTRQLLFKIFDILSNHKITLHNAFFTSNEIILILESSEAAKTYDLLQKKMIDR